MCSLTGLMKAAYPLASPPPTTLLDHSPVLQPWGIAGNLPNLPLEPLPLLSHLLGLILLSGYDCLCVTLGGLRNPST